MRLGLGSNRMYLQSAAVVAGLALGLVSGAANASVLVDVMETGNNVSFSATGSLNLAGLSFNFGSNSGGSLIVPNTASFIIGDQGGDIDLYTGSSRPGNFGPGGFRSSSTDTGPSFGYGLGNVFLPKGYRSGDLINSTSLFLNSSFATLGVTPGTYEYKWSSDEIVLQIGPASVGTVPLPGSAPMFGAALLALGAVGYGVKRKKAAAAA